jgi:hypothetical protein
MPARIRLIAYYISSALRYTAYCKPNYAIISTVLVVLFLHGILQSKLCMTFALLIEFVSNAPITSPCSELVYSSSTNALHMYMHICELDNPCGLMYCCRTAWVLSLK